MPALREMRDDIPAIAKAILDKLAQQSGIAHPPFSSDALKALQAYDFPGNVRELENILERALALSGGVIIQPDDLYLKPTAEASHEQPQAGDKWPLLDYLDRVEKEAIMEALEKTRFNKTA